MMKTSENRISAIVFCLTSSATNPRGLRPGRSWTTETMACQAVSLAKGTMGTGIQPARPLQVLVVHPPEISLDDKLWSEALSVINVSERSAVLDRIAVRTVDSTLRGRKFIEALKSVRSGQAVDVLIVHSVKAYFPSAASAGYALQKHFPELSSSAPVSNRIPLSATPPGPSRNAAVFAPSIVFNGMHSGEGGPVAWTEYFASEAGLFHSAILYAGGTGGFFRTSERQRVIIFSAFLPSATAVPQATCWASRELTPPSAACTAIQFVRWVTIVSSATRFDVESLIMREAVYWRDQEDYVIVLWQFSHFGIAEKEAAAFLSKAILGYESIEPAKLG